jgi:hypothetical protein
MKVCYYSTKSNKQAEPHKQITALAMARHKNRDTSKIGGKPNKSSEFCKF